MKNSKRKYSEKRLFNNFSKNIMTVILIIFQLIFLAWTISFYDEHMIEIFGVIRIISLIFVLRVLYKSHKPMFRVSWIILILAFPFAGCISYIIYGGNRPKKSTRRRFERINDITKKITSAEVDYSQELKNDPQAYGQARLLANTSDMKVYRNSSTKFLKVGEVFHECLLEEFEKAKEYIFFETFILASGKMWDEIREVLLRKADEGVQVFIIFDEAGSRSRLPKELREHLHENIHVQGYNPFSGSIINFINLRDHRKIVVVDGEVAILGGMNVGDEYINHVEVYGHWKDTAVRFEGESVKNVILMFINMWDICSDERLDFEEFVSKKEFTQGNGYMLPYGDGMDNEKQPAENIYYKIVSDAKEYVHICTPYLVLDDQMVDVLMLAARSEVEVKIVLPGIQDKPAVRHVNLTYYPNLLMSGVKIYEYTPGFLHAKSIVSDDKVAVIGSINFDFRSLYWNFESAVWMYNTEAVADMEVDFQEILEKSEEITYESVKNRSFVRRIYDSILKVVAPMF